LLASVSSCSHYWDSDLVAEAANQAKKD